MAHQPTELHATVELQTGTGRHTEAMTSLYSPLEADIAKKDSDGSPIFVKGGKKVLTKKEARKERREGHWVWLYITLARFGLINDW